MRWERLAIGTAALGGLVSLSSWFGGATKPAPEPETVDAQAEPPSEVGELGPLIPFHKDAVFASLVWTQDDSPKILLGNLRPAEYRGSDLVVPTNGPLGTLNPTFQRLVYGGFRFSVGPHGLDESDTTRIKSDIPRDNVLFFDLTDPDAFKNNGKFHVEELDERDFALNAAAFSDMGHSKGLNYNIFCSGNVALPDGRLLFIGGHDKTGNAGIRKLNIFDPGAGTWVARPIPQVKADFLADPTGLLFPHADPLDELNTDPPDPSDMKYQRWYATGVTLPDGRVLILSGTDEDTSKGPANAGATKVRQAVPEVYDPETDTTIALENARKLLPMYPRSYVVQTGPERDDWKVAVTAEVVPPLPGEPGGKNIRVYDPWFYKENTYFLDVLGALADPDRGVPGENHWEFVDTGIYAHDNGAGAALWTLDDKGMALSQKVILFGGESGACTEGSEGMCSGIVATVEMIDFQDTKPQWQRQDDLVQPATQNNAVVLPDGKVLIIGGRQSRPTSSGGAWHNSFYYQMFDPGVGEIRPLVKTTIARHDHSTAFLLPDASVIAMGGNRTDLADDPSVEGRAKGVPVAQIYKPPYLFGGERPVIDEAPDEVSYGTRFRVRVSGNVESVVIIRTGPVTHYWDWGNRYVKLAFRRGRRGTLIVTAPAAPGLAVPGYYMLFVLSDEGVPSTAKLVHLNLPE